MLDIRHEMRKQIPCQICQNKNWQHGLMTGHEIYVCQNCGYTMMFSLSVKNNPFVKPGSVKVDEIFTKKGQVCPLTKTFDSAEQMLATFDKPEELFVVTYAPDNQAIAHKRDFDYIERKRQLTDEFIARTGKKYGQLTIQDAIWVNEQVERTMLECN